MALPLKFTEQMRALSGFDFEGFEQAMEQPPPVSIRFNPAKQPQVAWPDSWVQDPVFWHPSGRYLPERPVFTLDPLLHAGAYYVQEAASMFLHEAVQQSVDTRQKLRVLDLCAAPGGKSTLLVSMLTPDSLLVSNEVIRNRTGPLKENMERWGYPNVAITNADPSEFAGLEGFFDVIVADAPCSGEGLFRKDAYAASEWSPAHVEFCAARQKKILAAAIHALAPGGVLIFSTCTYNTQENEENVQWMAASFGMEIVQLNISAAWNIQAASDGGYHFYPHKTRGEGFFAAVLRKKPGSAPSWNGPTTFRSLKNLSKNQIPEVQRWLQPDSNVRFFETPSGDILAFPQVCENDLLLLDNVLKNKWFGVNIGAFKGKDFIPSHALALSLLANAQHPAVDLSLIAAVQYLRKDNFDLPPNAPAGWVLARYAGLNLGWMKVLPNRINNYLPIERRILMQNRT